MTRCAPFGLFLLAGVVSLSCYSAPQPLPPAEATAAAEPRPSLTELCNTFVTDKCDIQHNYVELYEKFFAPVRDDVTRILEIGVLFGKSVRMWEAYFPRASVHGIDIKDSSKFDTDRISTYIADQSSREQLSAVLEASGSDFDIVVDDGGHTMEQQQVSFGFLFPHVRPGGMYVIEDIHTSFPNLYPNYGVEPGEKNSTFFMIMNFVRGGRFSSQYLTEQEEEYLTAHVEHCLYSLRANTFHSDFFLCQKKAAPHDAPS